MSRNFSPQYPNVNPNDFNIKKHLILLLSKWYWLILTLALAFGGAYFYNNSVSKKYSLESLIIFEEESRQYRRQSDNALENMNLLQEINQFNLESEIEVLKSQQLIRKSLEKLDFGISYHQEGKLYNKELYPSTPFQVRGEFLPKLYAQPVYIQILSSNQYKVIINEESDREYLMQFGEEFSKDGYQFTLIRNKNYPQAISPQDRFYFKAHSIDALTRVYQHKLLVEPIEENSHIIKLRTVGEVPEKEEDFMVALIDSYQEYQMNRINKNADISIEFITQQLEKIEQRLIQYENELQSLWMSNNQIRNNYVYPSQSGSGNRQPQFSSSSSYDQLNELERQKTNIERNREDFVYLSELIQNNRNIDSIVLPMTREIEAAGISQLIGELSSTQSQMNASNQNVEPSHPIYQSLNQQYIEQKQSLLTKVNTYIDYMDKSIAKLEDQIQALEREIPSYPRAERRYRETMRKIEQNQNIQNILSDKKIEFELVRASKSPNFDVLKEPRKEQANLEYPNSKFNYLIAFFIGLVVPASLLIMKKSNYSKIEEKDEIKNNTSIPILHALEQNAFKTHLPVYSYPQSPMADGFRNIRTKLLYRLKSYDHKVIMVSSMVSGEGKSFVSANLAAILAMAGMNTVIVSADIRKPTIHKMFSLTNKVGLSDYLSNNFNYEDLIQPTQINNLFIIPPGKYTANAGDLFSDFKISALLDYLSSRFEYIIFDSPPYSMVPESMVIGGQSHCNIFIIRHNYSPKNIIEALNEIHQEGRLKNMFLLVNGVKAMKGFGFEHYFGYDSSYGFGHYNKYYNNKKVSKEIPEHAKLK